MSPLTYTVYETATGRVVGIETQVASEMRPPFTDIGYYGGEVDGSTHMIDVVTEEPVPRPAWPAPADKVAIAADGVEEVTFSSVPVGTACWIVDNGIRQDTEITDGELVLTMDHPGTCVVNMVLFPYLPYEVTINAT